MKKEERGNRMETQALGTLVLSMSLTMMASLLIQSLYNIVDSIFASRISQEALTAAFLA
jgi:Na+-driven multidrug efflux pump